MIQNECFSNMVQDFLVCTTVHKASSLGVNTVPTLVRVSIDKMTKSTKTCPHTENPFYNEYFVFSFNCTLNELLRKTMCYEVRTVGSCCNTLHGEMFVDLSSVWAQPNRYFFKKWGRLEESLEKERKNHCPKPKGYLQIDIAIVTDASNTDLLFKEVDEEKSLEQEYNKDYDDIKSNMLTNIDPKVECNTRYTICFFYGVFVKKMDYYVQFTFHPFKGRTKMHKSTYRPEFNEYATFTWSFPSVSQTLILQIFSREHFNWKCIAEYELHFNEIAFKERPKLGPTYLHFYDLDDPFQYVGRVLIEIRSECLTEKIPPRELAMGKVLPSEDSRWWQNEFFNVEFIALQGDFMNGNLSNGKITMKLAEYTSNSLCFNGSPYYTKKRVCRKQKFFQQVSPYKSINILAELPDNRHKYDSDYLIEEIIFFMKSEIEAFKLFQIKYSNQYQMQIKCLKSIILSILSKIKAGVGKNRLEYLNYKDPTPWDTNRVVYLQDVMINTIPEQLNSMLKALKNVTTYTIEHTIEDVVQQLHGHCKNLLDILCITRIQDDWPELFLIISSGSKDVAMCRVNPKLFLNTPMDKELSSINSCWCVRHFVFKDVNCMHTCSNCGCIAAIINGCLGIVAESERNNFLDEVYGEWLSREKFLYSPTILYSFFKCRVYVYQAKICPGHDKTGLCEAFARVIFNGVSAETSSIPETLSPTWNVVFTFDNIRLPGLIDWYQARAPLVAIEMYDVDKHTSDDYLGCGLMTTSVVSKFQADKYNHGDNTNSGSFLRKYQKLKNLSPPLMKWIPISVNGMIRAEVLASAELVQVVTTADEDEIKTETNITVGIPMRIRPNMKNFVLEIVFVGFRNYMKSFCGRHRVKIMMGDLLLWSGLTSSRMRNSINFLVLYASGVVNLPEELEYWPTIIATDVLVSGCRETTIGAMILTNSKRYLQRNKFIMCMEKGKELNTPRTTHTKLFVETNRPGLIAAQSRRYWQFFKLFLKRFERKRKSPKFQIFKESEFTWWTKFYNSINKNTPNFNPSKHSLTVFDKELERHAEFSYMHDWAEPIAMVHSIKHKKNTIPEEEIYATLKLHIKITPCRCDTITCGDGATLRPLATALNPEYQSKIQALAEICKIFVRVYIVQGINFRPRDKNNNSDAYVKVRLGSKSFSNRAHFMPNQTNPVFGKCFELEGLLPKDHLLEVTAYDKNFLKDNIIGTTLIDLEDRWRTKHRAAIGLANAYNKCGYNEWRDAISPFDLLHYLCSKYNIDVPQFQKNTITVDGQIFVEDTDVSTDEELRQRLSLTVLKNLETLPSFGYRLVPEHVETRSLFRANSPGIEQGKLQLWVELFDGSADIPRPIDITPLKPLNYELRIVILDCNDIRYHEKNIFGTRISDLFVLCWCNDLQKFQQTDTHHRSRNGAGSFNWRMIFPIKYSPIEDMMICRRKAGIGEEYETKQPAILYLQIWDNDNVSKEEFLAAFELNLANFPEPYRNARECNEANTEYETGWRPFGASAHIKENCTIKRKAINLFQEKRVKGWFPLKGGFKKIKNKSGGVSSTYAGKIELVLEILTDTEACHDPAGLGRDEPNALPSPSRPDLSFNPYLKPEKTCRYIIWPLIRKYGLSLTIISLVLAALYVTIMKFPFIMTLLNIN